MGNRSLPLIYPNELEQHQTEESCWIVHDKYVYDITPFLKDHPGGPELILEHVKKNLLSLMQDPSIHDHSESAYDLLQSFLIGMDASSFSSPSTSSSSSSSSCSFHSTTNFTQNKHHLDSVPTSIADTHNEANEDTRLAPELKARCQPFLDLSQPLFYQLVTSNFSKAFYLEQIHLPRHLPSSCIIFGHPFMEMLTRTPWYLVPLVWVPFSFYLYSIVSHPKYNLDSSSILALYSLGLGLWTLCEYVFHRFLFHMDALLPDHPYALAVHFLLHGIHHFLPMDPLRLVLPPVLFALLLQPPYWLLQQFFEYPTSVGLLLGAIHGYLMYDLMHYYLHHAHQSYVHSYFKEMKSYHMAHHYKQSNLGFGITSKVWDYVFQTVGPSS